MSAGAASSPRNEVTKTPHTKIGIRVKAIPGARLVMIVAIMFTPDRHDGQPDQGKAIRYEFIPATF